MGQLYKLVPIEQHGDDAGQLMFEVGKVTFSTTDSQATFRTLLTEIHAGQVNLTDTWSAATDAAANDAVAVPLGAVSSGAITLTRSSKGSSGAVYSVLLIGRRWDTN